MITLKEERKAFHEVGLIFSEWGWGFREQSQDWGFDVLIEMAYQKRLVGKVGFLQIKGSDHNFYRSKRGITFYFSKKHCEYWLSLAERNPVFIILDDFSENKIYWILLTDEKVVKTSKGFKVIIPYDNLLNLDLKERFENILINYPFEDVKGEVVSDEEPVEGAFFDVSMTYQFDVKKGVVCSLKKKQDKVDIILGYNPGKNSWDKKNNELDWEDPYYYTLWELERYIRDKYLVLKANKVEHILEKIKNEIEIALKEKGILGLAEMLFDWSNLGKEIYKYWDFIRAFEQYSGLQQGQYKVRTIGQEIEFITDDKKYLIDTYEGKSWELKTLIENERYEDIYVVTEKWIWSEIYIDGGIEKMVFIPEMLSQWERYWDQSYREVEGKIGKTDHLDKMKEKSWREFQMFEAGYNDVGDVIHYAWELNDMELYPLAVLTMMNIFDRDCCYDEYCEYEFNRDEWEAIYVDESEDAINSNEKFFYIKESDF